MNFKLINFMLINSVNKQISYFFPVRCFLNLINFMLMNFVNKQISYFFHLDVFLNLIKFTSMNFKLDKIYADEF